MTPDGDEPRGWDPTRPLADRADGRSRSRERARGSREEPGDGAAGDASDGAREAGGTVPGSGDASGTRREDAGTEGDVSGGATGAGEGAGPGREGAGDSPVLLPHLERLAALATRSSGLEEGASRYAAWVEEALRDGGKVVLCGNGGSAATAEHVAAEYVVRFERDRRPLPAVALSASGPALTAAANDYSFPAVFERQLAALAGPDDLLVLHSTSGESENLLRAARAAREAGIRTVGLLAAGGGALAREVDLALVVPTDEAARAQELHLAVEHAVVERVERALDGGGDEGGGGADDGDDGG